MVDCDVHVHNKLRNLWKKKVKENKKERKPKVTKEPMAAQFC